MVSSFEKVEAIKIRVLRWKDGIMHQQYARSGFFQDRVIGEIMQINRPYKNSNFLTISTQSIYLPLEPMLLIRLPCPVVKNYTWEDLFYSIFTEHKLVFESTAKVIAKTVCAYLLSNFRVSQKTFDGLNNFKIVIAVDVYVKRIVDFSEEFDTAVSLSNSMLYEALCSDELEKSESKSTSIQPYVCKASEINKVMNEFIFGGWTSSMDLCSCKCDDMILQNIIDCMKKTPECLCSNPVESLVFEEVEPPLKIKKYEGCGSENTCAICLEGFSAKDRVIVTCCSHVFHKCCIFSWLKENESCPMCRSICYASI